MFTKRQIVIVAIAVVTFSVAISLLIVSASMPDVYLSGTIERFETPNLPIPSIMSASTSTRYPESIQEATASPLPNSPTVASTPTETHSGLPSPTVELFLDDSDAPSQLPGDRVQEPETQLPSGTSSEIDRSQVRPIIIDHWAVEQFDKIPDEFIQAASQLRWLHRGASVGYNIAGTADIIAEGLRAPSGLNCLSWTDLEHGPFEGGRPNSCGCPQGPLTQRWENFCRGQTIFFPIHSKYNRDNWAFEVHPYRVKSDNIKDIRNPNPGWQNKVNYFIQRVDNLAPNESYDYVSFQMGYVEGPTINEHFFTNNGEIYNSDGLLNYNDRQPGVSNLEALSVEHPEFDIIWTTSALSRLVELNDHGQPYVQVFNIQLRNYALANNKILFDLADIESHLPDGTPCYGIDRNGNPVNVITVCDEYVDEEIAGHLNALGANQVAKAIWVMMARLSGWTG